MTTQSDFEKAQRKPRYRQKFLDELDRKDLAAQISKIKYLDLSDGNINMDTVRDNGRSAIMVYPFAFEKGTIMHADDFHSCLEDHEFVHVRQRMEPGFKNELTLGPASRRDSALTRYLIETLMNAKFEIPAYTHQLSDGAYNARISPQYRTHINNRLKIFTSFAETVKSITGASPDDLFRNPIYTHALICCNNSAIYDALQRAAKRET